MDTFENSHSVNAAFTAPLCKSLGTVAYTYFAIVSFVIGLFNAGSPVTIGFAVTFVVITALYGVLGGRARSHIEFESSEKLPTFAHCNPASTVPRVSLTAGILATAEDRTPNIEKWCIGFTVCCETLSPIAATRSIRVWIINQVMTLNRSTCPAYTGAFNVQNPVSPKRPTYHCPASEFTTDWKAVLHA